MTRRYWVLAAEGNRYVVVDDERSVAPMLARLAEPHDELRADGVLVATPAAANGVGMRIFNPDGSEAGMCGNGARCVAALALVRRWASPQRPIVVRAPAGTVAHRVLDVGEMRMEGTQQLASSPIRAVAPGRVQLDLGVPHLVLFGDLGAVRLAVDGPAHERSIAGGTNVMFAAAESDGVLRVLPWERAAGAVGGCATGAAAAAIAVGVLRAGWPPQTRVRQPGGTIDVVWRPERGELRMTGRAAIAAEGVV